MPVWRRSLNLALAAALLLSASQAATLRARAQTAAQTSPAPAPTTAGLDAKLAAVEKAVEEGRQKRGIPGLSLVIVKDDKVVYVKGLGYRDFERKVPVTPDTLFAIGSSTKAFTSMLVAMGADEGKISLDDSPKKFLPYFKLQDPEADAKITVRDLLSHSSGLNRTDLAWITGVLNREEVIQVAARAKPTAKLREKWQYQNVMYSAAGECVAKAENSTWESLIKERIFKPLGMRASTLNAPDTLRSPDYSLGYVYDEDTKETRRLPMRDFPQVAAAGAINSNARDMAQWLRLMLGGGAFEGKRLVSEASFAELLKPQIKIAGNVYYGLGWMLRDWHGHKVAEHAGNIDGFNAQVALMPDQRLGFVMLTNVSASTLPSAAMEAVWSNLVGDPDATKAGAAPEAAAVKVEDEAGNYLLAQANVTMTVAAVEGKLTLSVPGQPTYALENVGGRRYKLSEAPGFFVTFRPSKDDPKDTEMYLEQPQGNYTLKRVKPADATAAAASGASAEYTGPLKEVVGAYDPEGEGPAVEVALRDGRVVLVVPGQPPYPLVERSKDVLGSTALPESYSVLVRRDASGKIVGITLRQPQGEFAFRRAAAFKPTMTADELMAKVVEAAGGESALRRHRSMRAVVDLDFEHQGVTGEGTIYSKAPNASAQEVTINALGKRLGAFHEYFDGAQGGDEATFAPFEPKTGKNLEDARIASDFYAPLDWKRLFKSAEIKRNAKVGDEDAYVVVFTPEKGNPVTNYYSTKTFLLLRQDTTETSGPVNIPVSEKFGDYRPVDGVMIAFTRVSNTVTMGDTLIKVREVKFDVPVPEDVFRRKLTK
ncbi:MAG TPA: serine hydrolase [Pyrinomonadaceae bacterium]|jgi:CubicO group peptidase (beta-lactamase class C family)|nr:serine hydrolase [Pyrinomonadaceae bacterium]